MVGPAAVVVAGAVVVVWLDVDGGAAVVVDVFGPPAADVLPPQAAARTATAASGTPNAAARLEIRPGMVPPTGEWGTGYGLSSRVHIPYVPGRRKVCAPGRVWAGSCRSVTSCPTTRSEHGVVVGR